MQRVTPTEGVKKVFDFAQSFKKDGGTGSKDGGMPGLGGDSGVVDVYVTNWEEREKERRDNPNSSNNSDFKKGLAAKGLNATLSQLPLLDSNEALANFQKIQDEKKAQYPYADLDSFIPAPISNWMNKPDDLSSPPNLFGDWSSSSATLVGELIKALPEAPEPAKPADGKITVVVESSEGLTVRTKSVQSENVDLRVNTGYSGGNTY